MRPFWYALTVKPRHEKAAAQNLRLRGLEEFLPLQRVRRAWSDRVQAMDVPLFPGYVFSRFGFQDRLRILNTPGITSIVGFGAADVPVDDTEIESVRTILASGLPVSPWPYLKAGDTVRIEHGALEGVRGSIIREKNPWRVVVSLELLHRAVAVELDRERIGLCPGSIVSHTCPQQRSC